MSLRVDNSSLITASLIVGDTGLGVLGSTVPATGDAGPGFLYNDLSLPADDNKEVRGEILTQPAAGALVAFEDSSFEFTGSPDGSYSFTYQLYVDGVATGGPTLVSLEVGAASVEGSGAITEAATTSASGTKAASAAGIITEAAASAGATTSARFSTGAITETATTLATGTAATGATGSGAITEVATTSATATTARSASGSISETATTTATGTTATGVIGSGAITEAATTSASGIKTALSAGTITDATITSGTASTARFSAGAITETATTLATGINGAIQAVRGAIQVAGVQVIRALVAGVQTLIIQVPGRVER